MTAETAVPPSEKRVTDLLTEIIAVSLDRTNLDPVMLMAVRIAALVAVDAPPLSYVMNLGVASELGITAEQIQDIVMAIAPIVGTTRIVSAAEGIERALGMTIILGER